MTVKPFVSAALAAAVMMGLTGCFGTPVTSIPSIARIDFETTDVSQLAVAVRVPESLRSAPEGAVLTLMIMDEDNPGQFQTGNFLLEQTDAARSDEYLLSQRKAGTDVRSYRLRRADVPLFRALRALRFTADGENKRGALTARPRLCRPANWKADKLPVSVYLRTSETKRFVPVRLDYDLRQDLDDETLNTFLPVCDKQQRRLSKG
ncbi:MAG: hypothetical protein AAFY73_06530 [Pseudomonadota bacterium]